MAVRSLSRLGFSVYTCSHHQPSMSAWSRFGRAGAVVADPFEAPALFARDVGRLVEQLSIDVVLPCHEDALVLRRFEDALPLGTVLACPDLELLELGIDKARVTKLAIEAGVPTPRTEFPQTIEGAVAGANRIGYPVVAKLRRSNSGKGVVAVNSDDELVELLRGRFARYVESHDRFPILQELVPGQVVGACFVARKGAVQAVFCERYLRCKESSFGTSVFRGPLQWPRLLNYVTALAKELKWTGIGHFDFIEGIGQDEAYLLELNPRLWGAINLAFVNGFDFPGAVVEQALGREDLAAFFEPKSTADLRSIWMVGELIGAVNRWQSGERIGPLRAFFEFLGSLPRSRFDDFVWHDPLPLLAEAGCYAKLFLKSGRSTNPLSDGMFE